MSAGYHWDWLFFMQNSIDGTPYYEMIAKALCYTVTVSAISFALALILGLFFGVLRTLDNKLARWIAVAYINLFRNIPLLAQLFLWFFVIPELLPVSTGDYFKQHVSPMWFGIVGLAFFTSSRIASQVRSGIEALPEGLRKAGQSLGMSTFQVYWHLLIPAMLRIIIPALTSSAMNHIKNSSVTYSIGVTELYFQYKSLIEKTSQIIEVTCIITLLYFVLNFLIFILLRRTEKSLSIPGLISSHNEETV